MPSSAYPQFNQVDQATRSPGLPPREEFLTVSELNQFIKDVINAGFPQALWICGEIQQFDRSRNKNHIFFELVEKDPASQDIVARIGLVIFANRKNRIEEILKRSENAFALKDDIEVKFSCKVDFYPPHGDVRLIVESIDPVYTLGKIAQERQKLIALLQKQGVLDKNKQVPLPAVPLNIGLITADDSAAYNDFCSELRRSGLAFKIFLRNTLMQGRKSEGEVCRALKTFERMTRIDVIVITRGGGSIAELSCFDSDRIARQIAVMSVQVLSGIGHEINTTITDMAAHTYAKTPTAIARFLVETVENFLRTCEEELNHLLALTEEHVQGRKRRLRDCAVRLHNGTRQFLREHFASLIRLGEFLKHRPVQVLKDQRKEILQERDKIIQSVRRRIQQEHIQIKNYQKMIDMVHPQNTLKRGFSITRGDGGRVVKKVKDVRDGSLLSSEFVDGTIASRVTSIHSITK